MLQESSQKLVDKSFLSIPSTFGLILGALAFLASLTPSMIPRSETIQGVVGGISFAIGYGVGVLVVWIGQTLGVVSQQSQKKSRLFWLGVVLAAVIALAGIFNADDWQNSVRQVMKMPNLEEHHSIKMALIAAMVALLLIFLGRVFRRIWIVFSNLILRFLPLRVARLIGLVIAIMLFWSLGSGVLIRGVVDALDRTYARVDTLIPNDSTPPVSPLKSGSVHSLVSWESLGAQGRNHMTASPSEQEIAAFTGKSAKEPIRVYVGVNSADEPAERARLALEELKRTDAFSRRNLVIATPTGTGWVDNAATSPLEYLLLGDVATVSVQYSYLPSWLSVLVDPESGSQTAKEVFRAVYGHWVTLPKDSRPRLYLFGLSLGSFNSDLSVDVYDILREPYNGALWVGQPFSHKTWNRVVERRVEGTTVWRPRVGDGQMFRFATQKNLLSENHAEWGPLRVIFLQYPSDPLTFFEPENVFHAPKIYNSPRPPDISPELRWIPVISYLQLVVDMATAVDTPVGFGHVFAASDYLDSWVALIGTEGWSQQDIEGVRQKLANEGL